MFYVTQLLIKFLPNRQNRQCKRKIQQLAQTNGAGKKTADAYYCDCRIAAHNRIGFNDDLPSVAATGQVQKSHR